MAREIKKRQEPEEPPVRTDEFVVFEEIVNVLAEEDGVKSILEETHHVATPASPSSPAETKTTAQKMQKGP